MLSNDNIGIRYQDTGIYGAGLILNCFGDVEIVLAGDNWLTVEERECLCGLSVRTVCLVERLKRHHIAGGSE